MGSRYRYVGAVGQEDKNACWAACLSWWLKATNKRRIEQWEIMDDDAYSDFWDVEGSSGTISREGLLSIMKDPRWGMVHQVVERGSDLTSAVVEAHLNFGPIYVGYYDVVVGGNHVNIIYDISGAAGYPQVKIMEPAGYRKRDGSYKGKHLERGLTYYRAKEVILASPKDKLSLDR